MQQPMGMQQGLVGAPAFLQGGSFGKLGEILYSPSVTSAEVRKYGMILMGIGLFCIVFTVGTIMATNYYFYYPTALVPIGLFLGGYFLALGKPLDATTGQPPSWWQLGAMVVGGVSLLMGIGAVVGIGL